MQDKKNNFYTNLNQFDMNQSQNLKLNIYNSQNQKF
jgi:hypothetical protein